MNFFATLRWFNEELQECTREWLGKDKVDKCQLRSLICCFFFPLGQLAHCKIQTQVFCWHQMINYHSGAICTTTALTSWVIQKCNNDATAVSRHPGSNVFHARVNVGTNESKHAEDNIGSNLVHNVKHK